MFRNRTSQLKEDMTETFLPVDELQEADYIESLT
jgi:hypothetical protein